MKNRTQDNFLRILLSVVISLLLSDSPQWEKNCAYFGQPMYHKTTKLAEIKTAFPFGFLCIQNITHQKAPIKVVDNLGRKMNVNMSPIPSAKDGQGLRR